MLLAGIRVVMRLDSVEITRTAYILSHAMFPFPGVLAYVGCFRMDLWLQGHAISCPVGSMRDRNFAMHGRKLQKCVRSIMQAAREGLFW